MTSREATKKKVISSESTDTLDSNGKGKRRRVSQTDFPQLSLEKALRIGQCIYDEFAGISAPPHQIAIALGLTPTSGGWRNRCGTSIAYGLTEGGYNAQEIKLTPLGRKIVGPQEEGEDIAGKVEAILHPRIMREFFERYDKAKFPSDDVAKNVLFSSFGLPKDRTSNAVDILKENGNYAGIISNIKTGLFVALDSPSVSTTQNSENETSDDDQDVDIVENIDSTNLSKKQVLEKPSETAGNNRVYISHGKNRKNC